MRNFKIEVYDGQNFKGYFISNSRKEDFVRFLPDTYDTEIENIKLYMLSAADSLYVSNNLFPKEDKGFNENYYDFSQVGKILIKNRDLVRDPLTEINEEMVTDIKEIVGVEVSNWPYKEVVTNDGKKFNAFIGWQL